MRVATVTYHHANYGALLQAYALQTALRKLGNTSQIIEYTSHTQKKPISSPRVEFKKFILNGFALLRHTKVRRRYERIGEFRRTCLDVTPRAYHSCDELSRFLPDAHAFICGSDQIWKPSPDGDKTRVFYLDFVSSNDARKIAYAPSFGVAAVSRQFKHFIRPLIEDIPHLSVRERTGQQIIRQTTGREAPVVLDPTLLLSSEDWSQLAVPPRIDPPFVLVYSTSQRRIFLDLVQHVKRRTALPVVVISAAPFNRIWGADHVIFDASPEEFVGLFASAACICTNSFHGMAFSLINRRPFWTTPHPAANTRLADLLDEIGLSDRQVADIGKLGGGLLEIDYSRAEKNLDEARVNSIRFLRKALAD